MLKKLEAQRISAEHMGKNFYRPPINVTFEDGVNHVGVEQQACKLCGDCVSGCNYSAKNTLIMNYLPDAANHGAEIFTKTSVRRVEQAGGEWLVHFDLHDTGREHFKAPPMFVRAGIVVWGPGRSALRRSCLGPGGRVWTCRNGSAPRSPETGTFWASATTATSRSTASDWGPSRRRRPTPWARASPGSSTSGSRRTWRTATSSRKVRFPGRSGIFCQRRSPPSRSRWARTPTRATGGRNETGIRKPAGGAPAGVRSTTPRPTWS